MPAHGGVSSPNASEPRPSEQSGSSRWASKPAETSSRSGSKSRSAGTAPRVERVQEPGLGRARPAAAGSRSRPRPRPRRARRPRRCPGRTATGGADVEHRRVVLEDRLGAVAVVGVPVEHGHPLDARRRGRGRPRLRRGSRCRSPSPGPPRRGGRAGGRRRTRSRSRRRARRRPPRSRLRRRAPPRRSCGSLTTVSGSSARRRRGAERSIAARWSGSWTRSRSRAGRRRPAPPSRHRIRPRRAPPRPSGRAAPGAPGPGRAA